MALFAEGILNLYWDRSVPVNLAHIAKKMGVTVVLSDSLPECARIDISPDNKARILIGKQQPLVRQRYGVAHALGHRALHHLRPGTQRLIEVSDNFHANHQSRIDSEANQFALALLIPSQALLDCVQQQRMSYLQGLADHFNVVPILIKQRLADLNLRLELPRPQRKALPLIERIS
ncbi:MAG: ImmA/IrrE family metallo-endopeptidase [Burkholderiaceae bacterium]|nr:ImmA/IrrE family metallo-endopeptidase [Burkholderiaceae bacterium]